MQRKTHISIVVGSVGVEYPRDPEFQSLAREIAEIAPDIDVVIPEPKPIDPRRRGVTWGELVRIYIEVVNSPGGEAAEGAAATLLAKKIVDVAGKWAQGRFNRLNHKRPKFIWVYSPGGKIEQYVKVSGPAEKPEDQKPELLRLARAREEAERRGQPKVVWALRKMFRKLFRRS